MKVKTKTSEDNRKGYWGGMLFALLFFGVGVGFLLLSIIPNLWDASRMQNWEHVPAKVEHLNLKTSRSDDTTTYKVIARFGYDYNGQHYNSDRVGIADGGSDNVGEWQRDTYRRLKDPGQLYLWVNPANPAEAVFDREPRWGLLGFKLIFVIVFGGFGGGLMWFMNRSQKPLPLGLPAWQSKIEWVGNNIRSNAKKTLWVAWGFTIFWNAISSPVLFILPAELEKGNQLAWVAVIFPLVGLGMLAWAIKQTFNWRRFGTTLLQMDPFPGAIGGDVGGALELRLAYNSKHRFRVTLTCQHVYTRRSNDGSTTVRDVKWQDEQLAEIQVGMRGTRLRFLFNPPDDLPESSNADSSRYEWTLQITASFPGTDFDRSWEVPVYKDVGPQTARASIRSRSLDTDTLPLSDKVVQIRETGSGLELYFPYLRHLGTIFGTLLTGAGFIGFAWLFNTAGDGDKATSLFIGLFTVVGILIIVWGFYMAGNSLRVTVGRKGFDVVRSVFGLRFSRELATNEISTIEKSIGMQTTQGNQSRAYYKIQVSTHDGRKITAGSGLTGASNVDAIIERMRRAVDLPEQASAVENPESRFRESPAAEEVAGSIADPQRVKRIRRWVNVGSAVVFFAFVFWNFRDVIFRLF